MIYRWMFVGYSKDVHSVKITADKQYYISLSYQERAADELYKVFMYVESNEESIDPESLVCGDIIPYPNGKTWERLTEIFHYSKPVNAKQWKRERLDKKPSVVVNQLKPEKVASYIFYHYQYQEEYPGDGDRYGIIFLHEQQIIFYREMPFEVESEKIAGAFSTKNTPKDQWNTLMEEHFADQWRGIPNLECTDYIEF